MANLFLCALCDEGGTLLRLKPSKWYACQVCVKQLGGRERALLVLVERLRVMAADNDPRLQIPANQEAILSLRDDLLKRAKEPFAC